MLVENTEINSPGPLRASSRSDLMLSRTSKIKRMDKVNAGKDQNHILAECLLKVGSSQDRIAFGMLFEHYAPRVKAYLMRSGANDGLAEECVQETMVTVWHKSKQFDPQRASATTWIFTIARNKKIDALRKQNRPQPDELDWGPDCEPDAADAFAQEQESLLLRDAISALPEKQKNLIQRAFYGDLSHQELAQETGLPLGTIKSRLRLALEKLRHDIKRA